MKISDIRNITFQTQAEATRFFAEQALYGKPYKFVYTIDTDPSKVYYIDEIVGSAILLGSGSGGAVLFPNGFEDVTESRNFQHSDVGKALRLAADDVFLTMPEGQFWTEEEKGQVIVVIADAVNVGFDKTFETPVLMQSRDGDNSMVGEYCLLVTGETDGQSDFGTISTAIIKDGDDWKTAIRYLYDKVGLVISQEFSNAMTLLTVGAPTNNPTGGVAVVWTNTPERPAVDIACYSDDFSFLTGVEVVNFNTINRQVVQLGMFNQASEDDFDDFKFMFVNDDGEKSIYVIGGLEDLTADTILCIDSATKKLKTLPVSVFNTYNVITVGNVTFADINSAPAATEISLSLASIPDGYYVETVYVDVVEDFDFLSELNIATIITNYGAFYGKFFPQEIRKNIIKWSSDFSQYLTDGDNFVLTVNFDLGGGEVNPQNYTTGSMTLKALINKYPD